MPSFHSIGRQYDHEQEGSTQDDRAHTECNPQYAVPCLLVIDQKVERLPSVDKERCYENNDVETLDDALREHEL